MNHAVPESDVIKKEIRDFLSTMDNTKTDLLKDDSLIFQEGFIESIGLIQLVVFLEDRFGFVTSDDDLIEENFQSLNAITSLILKKLTR